METAKLIEIEKGLSVITISDTYNIGDGKQVDTKMKPTIRTPRKRSRDFGEMPRDGVAASLQRRNSSANRAEERNNIT